ncbi:MAG: HNH endonuclease [Aquamicrobium sp.]|uniref:HNH endonuclease n=1 Tax=Aquamicrobium sp. TaxID=1872579 RepID=UPI00349EDE8C|nr:HNH endonuclease [Aquamicrobium sp.]
MARRRFTYKDRARIFAANNGTCHICKQKIDGVREAWEIEHVIAWELTRDDSDENLRPAHIACHKQKTHKQDRPAINEAKRREAKHTGAKRPSSKLAARQKQSKQSRHPYQAPRPLFQEIPQNEIHRDG